MVSPSVMPTTLPVKSAADGRREAQSSWPSRTVEPARWDRSALPVTMSSAIPGLCPRFRQGGFRWVPLAQAQGRALVLEWFEEMAPQTYGTLAYQADNTGYLRTASSSPCRRRCMFPDLKDKSASDDSQIGGRLIPGLRER
jgi:hypothetical protein